MSTPSDSDKDFFDELDDDLGEDWESAFQAEDFMFSPEDDTSNFFLIDEKHPEDNADIAALMEEATADKEEPEQPLATTEEEEEEEEEEQISPGRHLSSFLASFFLIYQQRPLYQRGIFILAPLLVLSIIGIFFFKGNNKNHPPQHNKEDLASTATISPVKLQPTPTKAKTVQPLPPPLTKPPTSPPTLIRKKWPFHSFFIMSQNKNRDAIIINIDLTIIASLNKDEPLSDERRVFLRDAIYQFYRNRPFKDLKRYSLARGDMIHQLVAWLKKQWPQANINTVIFRRYQIINNSAA